MRRYLSLAFALALMATGALLLALSGCGGASGYDDGYYGGGVTVIHHHSRHVVVHHVVTRHVVVHHVVHAPRRRR